jgi:N-formylglutamate amidohydrolase
MNCSSDENRIWLLREVRSPLIATAIHDGHGVRDEIAGRLALTESERLREEDPWTRNWTDLGGSSVIGTRSRFEVDLNRRRDRAVYRTLGDAWGLEVWRDGIPQTVVDRSIAEYDLFYSEMERLLSKVEAEHGKFVVYDLHSYNHRREGPNSLPADFAANPEVNVGTGTMDRSLWAPLVNRFIDELRSFNFLGRHLDVRENVRFRGGNFPRWVHQTFPTSGCALAIEVKKFFMDEWTGEADSRQISELHGAILATVPGVLEELANLK